MDLGFNNEISNEDYHGDRTYVSSSALKLILKDPKEYFKVYIKNEKNNMSRAAFDFGTYVHALVLEPDTIERDFAIFEGASRRGKVYDEFKKVNEGKIILTKSQALKADGMVEKLRENKKANDLIDLAEGSVEQTLCVELDGVKVKIRTDYNNQTVARINDQLFPFGLIIDVKTTSDPIDKFSIGKTIARYDYDLSAALYVDALQEQLGTDQTFIFCFMSKLTNEVEMYQASDEMIANGRRKYKAAIKKLKAARETGIYFDENAIPTVNLPYWAKFEDIDNDKGSDDITSKEVKKTISGSGQGDGGNSISTTHHPQGF